MSGHFPLTHYERTKKFKSSNYGTTTKRLSGDSQIAFGHCSLSLAPIVAEDGEDNSNETKNQDGGVGGEEVPTVTTIAMVTPSGHLYGKQAILEYLLTRTAEYKEKMAAYEKQNEDDAIRADNTEANKRQRLEAFDESNRVTKKSKPSESKTGKNSVLKRTSYWLPDMQPDKVDVRHKEPDRPASPNSGDPLRRKDLRELELKRKKSSEDVLCAISGKAIRMQPCIAYWVKGKGDDKNKPGLVVLKDVFELTIAEGKEKAKAARGDVKAAKLICPLTNLKIKHIIELKSGGSAFAAHNKVVVSTYKPTIT